MRADLLTSVLSSALAFTLVACGGGTTKGASGSQLGGSNHAVSGTAGTNAAAGAAGTNGNNSANQSMEDVPVELTIPDPLPTPPEETCQGLSCQQTTCLVGPCTQTACAIGATTTVSGAVYDPSGKLPLYNVTVYVPNGTVRPFTSGANCDPCDLSVEKPVSAALTDTEGKFTLSDVPVGTDIPLVMQIGKWRRQVKITVAPCVDNPLTDINQTRLPHNKTEGDIPLIAITTGGLDSMECLPRRLGIDDSEFTTGTGDGRIHLYHGTDQLDNNGNNNNLATSAFIPTLNAGAALTPATALWASAASLSKYDIVVLSCEGDTFPQDKPATSRDALYQYASLGGRVFASHWHHIWFSGGPGLVPGVGTWSDRDDPMSPTVATINTTFPKGQALSEWLVNVGASVTAGQINIFEARDNVQAVNAMYATEWMTIQNDQYPQAPKAVEYLSFNAPLDVAPEMQCGRAVYTDLHVSSTGMDVPGSPFPMGCEQRDLSSQEKAVAFMLFDLSACLIPDTEPPQPPQIIH